MRVLNYNKINKRFLCVLLSLVLMVTLIPQMAYGATTNASIGGTISQIVPLVQSEYHMEPGVTENAIKDALPKTLSVILEDTDEPADIPVSWICQENFSENSYYLYNFAPEWDKTEYPLSDKLSELWDIPWIQVIMDSKPSDAVHTKFKASSMMLNATASNETSAYNYCTNTMALGTAASSGVLTNLNQESGIAPNNLENSKEDKLGYTDKSYTAAVDNGTYKNFTTDEAGYGIAQWTSEGRKIKLLAKKKTLGTSIGNLTMQLKYLNDELTSSSYTTTYNALANMPNTEAGAFLSAAVMCQNFERPSDKYPGQTAVARGKLAVTSYWKKYGNSETEDISYLGICGYSYPKNVHEGTGVSAGGTVFSDVAITSVVATIINSNGTVVDSASAAKIDPEDLNKVFYQIGNLDNDIGFSKLSAGSYTYKIVVKDSNGYTAVVNKDFKVSSSEVSIGYGVQLADAVSIDQGYTYPTVLKKGSNFDIIGTISSCAEIDWVQAKVYTSSGTQVLSTNAQYVEGSTFNLADFTGKLDFASLKGGTYIYIVYAKAESMDSYIKLVKQTFKVESKKLYSYNYPTSIAKGSGFSIKGKICSDLKISKIRVYVKNSSGKIVLSKIVYPKATYYNIAKLDSYLKFGSLAKGTYYYKVYAVDSVGTKYFLNKKFTVYTPSTLKLSSYNYPTTVKKGKDFYIKGTVKSNYRLKNVNIRVYTYSGTLKKNITTKFTSKRYSYYIKNMNSKISFANLAKGKYYYRVYATDSLKTKRLISKAFYVK